MAVPIGISRMAALSSEEVGLVVKKQDGSAGGRDMVEKGEESFVGRVAEGARQRKGLGRSGVEGLPAAGAFEVGEGNPRGDTEGPGAKDGWLTQERKLPKDLERGLLEDVVGKGGAYEAGYVAAQRRIGITKELF